MSEGTSTQVNIHYEEIALDKIVERVKQMKSEGMRLVCMGGTDNAGKFELRYHFYSPWDAKKEIHLKSTTDFDAIVPNISNVYPNVTFQQIELHEMFDVKVDGVEGNLLLDPAEGICGPLRKGFSVTER